MAQHSDYCREEIKMMAAEAVAANDDRGRQTTCRPARASARDRAAASVSPDHSSGLVGVDHANPRRAGA